MAKGGDREVRAFEDGELWQDDEARPPASPAGWYVRRRKESHPSWVGPFKTSDEAATAALTSDPLRDAQRRLAAWQRDGGIGRGDDAVVRQVPTAPATVPTSRPEEARVPVATEEAALIATQPAPSPPAAPKPRGRRKDQRQFDLPL